MAHGNDRHALEPRTAGFEADPRTTDRPFTAQEQDNLCLAEGSIDFGHPLLAELDVLSLAAYVDIAIEARLNPLLED